MKPETIEVTIRNAAEDDKEPMRAGQLRWIKDEFMFEPDENLARLSASDLHGIARLADAANDLVRKS